MANDITINPLVIDTASAAEITTKTFKANIIRWVSKTAIAGDDLVIQNANGQTIYTSVAAGANYVEESHFEEKPIIFTGLIVPTLSSGTLYIYVADQVPIKT